MLRRINTFFANYEKVGIAENIRNKYAGEAYFFRAWFYLDKVQMYGDVVLGMKPVNKDDIDPFEAIIEEVKKEAGVKLDNELTTDHLKDLVKRFKAAVMKATGHDFPTDPYEQLWGAIMAVFGSWMNDRAILYRKMEGIPDDWGTAVNVQAMVFGNMVTSPLRVWLSLVTLLLVRTSSTVST